MSAKVLLVDDSSLARRSTRRLLENAGYTVVEAEDGLSALERFAIDKPDVVLLDLVMKGMYGLDVLRKLRELDPAARVIVVSADVQTSSHELVQAAGAAGFINKPAAPGQVVQTVEQVLSGGTSWS
jgi:two-component system chemotaxis response regulator CheY